MQVLAVALNDDLSHDHSLMIRWNIFIIKQHLLTLSKCFRFCSCIRKFSVRFDKVICELYIIYNVNVVSCDWTLWEEINGATGKCNSLWYTRNAGESLMVVRTLARHANNKPGNLVGQDSCVSQTFRRPDSKNMCTLSARDIPLWFCDDAKWMINTT